MNEYIIVAKHDIGTVKIRTAANNTGAAIRQIMEIEGCPRSAIMRCRNVTQRKAKP